jgi:cytochrome c-type biogenesis protein CcmH/NrfG
MPVDYSRGLQSVSIGDYTSAISFFQQLTLLHKEDFYSYFYLSGAYFQNSHYQQAVEALD